MPGPRGLAGAVRVGSGGNSDYIARRADPSECLLALRNGENVMCQLSMYGLSGPNIHLS